MNKLYTSIYNWNEIKRMQSEQDPIYSVQLADGERYTGPRKVRLTFKDYKQCTMFLLKYGEYL